MAGSPAEVAGIEDNRLVEKDIPAEVEDSSPAAGNLAEVADIGDNLVGEDIPAEGDSIPEEDILVVEDSPEAGSLVVVNIEDNRLVGEDIPAADSLVVVVDIGNNRLGLVVVEEAVGEMLASAALYVVVLAPRPLATQHHGARAARQVPHLLLLHLHRRRHHRLLRPSSILPSSCRTDS